MLGVQHAEAILEVGGIAVLADVNEKSLAKESNRLQKQFGNRVFGVKIDVTDEGSIRRGLDVILKQHGRVDGLINNAAHDPKVTQGLHEKPWSRFENFPLDVWNRDLSVGLTGAFLCSQIFGSEMAKAAKGVIVNIASDLGVIAPDQRIYRQEGLEASMQNVKPVTYSVCKFGIIGLTKYLATYWAEQGIRVNSISPGGVYNHQPEEFVKKLTPLIPLGRMAHIGEYRGAIQFLCSDGSSYMTGANLIIDGGRTCW